MSIRNNFASTLFVFMEQVRGIEPPYPAWEAGVLPLNYTCEQFHYSTIVFLFMIKIKAHLMMCFILNGASEGNRTPVSTLARSRSTIELHLHVMAVQTRIELAISSVTGRHVKPLHHWTISLKNRWRRKRDLNPRASFPTYTLSRGASSAS